MLVADGAVAADQVFARGLTVLLGDVEEALVITFQACDSDDADVHHDVDEVGVGTRNDRKYLPVG